MGASLNLLDTERYFGEVQFYHQLVQEYFAARQLNRVFSGPDGPPTVEALVHQEWRADRVPEPLEETLARLPDSAPLPPLDSTGWEETVTLAASLSDRPDGLVRGLMEANLPLAGACAAAPDARVSEVLKQELRWALVTRSQDLDADLRARIAAGEALGHLGDPRFERRTGPHGEYLLPPLAPVAGGNYLIGDDAGLYDDEGPAHPVQIAEFEMGMFPVTNAEYALFMQANGYEDERWWDTDAAKAWLCGEGSAEGQRQNANEDRAKLQRMTEGEIQKMRAQNRGTLEDVELAVMAQHEPGRLGSALGEVVSQQPDLPSARVLGQSTLQQPRPTGGGYLLARGAGLLPLAERPIRLALSASQRGGMGSSGAWPACPAGGWP